jgi:guanosine-3',5'-bis(diphosphate) 3'-pyrophosphohydrolase
LILRAAEFAAERHRDQRRKGAIGRPYIGHCIEVAQMIASAAQDTPSAVIAAALLHDTVEDTPTTIDEIRNEFGDQVASIVAEVTDAKGVTRETRRQHQVDNGPRYSPAAKLIKLADKISNVREIGEDPPAHWTVERQLGYFAWARQVVDALGRVNPALETCFLQAAAVSERSVSSRAIVSS